MTIRRLKARDAAALGDHLVRLNPEARSQRFMGGMHDAAVREHVGRIDWSCTLALGWWHRGVLRAAVELYAPRVRSAAAEVAVSVETPWQNHGVGTELLRRALLRARNRRAQRMVIDCTGDNHRMRRIAAKLGGRLRARGGECEAQIPLPACTAGSLWYEAAQDLRDRLIRRTGVLEWCLDGAALLRNPVPGV